MSWKAVNPYGVTGVCKDCTLRVAGCHSSCKKYKDFKDEIDRVKGEIAISNEYKDYKNSNISKISKSKFSQGKI